MTFLTPFAAITAGAIAAPVLIAFYLLKLRRRPVRVGSTMLWEQAIRDLQVNVPFRFLRPSWLLLLHLLILALFVLALGRPTIEGTIATGGRVFLVIDRSASMAVRDEPGGPTRLERAIDRAAELADGFTSGAGPEITVVTYAQTPSLTGRPARTSAEVRRQLAGVSQTDQGADPRAAFELVEALAPPTTTEDEEPEPVLVVVLSDGGSLAGQRFALRGAEVRYERLGPADGAPPPDNVGIVSISGARDRADPALVRLYVGLANASTDRVAAPVAIRIDGSEAERVAIRVPGAAEGVPGEAGRTFQLRLPDAAVIEARIERDDQLTADNRASLVVPPARRPAILLVAPGPEGAPTPDPFLADVLAEYPTRQLRTVSATTYERLANAVGGFDLILFDRVSPVAPPARPSLVFGAAMPGLEGRPASGGTVRITSWDRAHPVLAPITLDALVIARRTVLPAELPEASAFGSLEVLASTRDGPAIIEARRGRAAHLVLGFEVAQSNWPVQISFPIFIAAAVEHLAPQAGAAEGVWFRAGEPVRVPAPAGVREVRLSGPGELSGQASDPGGLADVGVAERSGVYRVAGVPGPAGAVAVNLADLDETALGGGGSIAVAGAEVSDRSGERAGTTELWPWLVGAAFVLLLLDWALYAILMRA